MKRIFSTLERGAICAAFVIFAATSVGAMGKRQFPSPDELPPIDPTGTAWIITQVEHHSWFPADQIARIEFDATNFYGRAPCNSFRGPRKGNGLSPFIASTRAACDLLAEEQIILKGLGRVTELRMTECHGVGLDKDGHLVVTFYRERPPQICQK